jgi:hypothetical protein
MIGHYILEGREPKPVTMLQWAVWFGRRQYNRQRIVAQTQIAPGLTVSTVFLGLDHNFSGKGPPLLFETMVFNDYGAGDCWRWATWGAAEAGHLDVVDQMEAKLKDRAT